jgi:hypothetical protein
MNQQNIDIVHDITGNEDCDYAEFIPWGPAWFSGKILAMLEYKDRASAFNVPQSRKPQAGERKKSEPVHHHSYVTGIEGVIDGHSSNFWCRYCKQNKPLEQGGDGKDVSGPLRWECENQVLQDLDKGFRRSFAGSFQPVQQENWAEGVYAAGYQPRDAPHPLVTQLHDLALGTSPSSFGSSSIPASTDLYVGAGGQRFESQNQLLRHMRENAPISTDPPSLFGNDLEAFNGKPSTDIFAQNVKAFGGGTLPFWATTVSDTPTKSAVIRNLNSPQKPVSSPVPSYSYANYGAQTVQNTSSWNSNNNNNNTSVNISYDNKPARAVPPAWWSLFGKGTGSTESQMSFTSQALLLVAALYRKGAITLQVKSELKDLILQNDLLVKSVVEAFFIDTDLGEVVDSLTRVLEISKKR